MSEQERICRTRKCPTCQTPVGQPCKTTSGRTKADSHAARHRLVIDKINDAHDRRRCPIHGITDCSPLLNGCSELTRRPANPATKVDQ